MKTKDFLELLGSHLAKHENETEAVRMSAYMKDRYRFFGIKTPVRTAVLKQIVKENGIPTDLAAEGSRFLKSEFREINYCGIELIGKAFSKQKEALGLFEKIIPIRSWWDSVDSINTRCLRPYFLKFPEELDKVTLRWASSDDFWFQRVSVICQLRANEKTDLEVLTRNINMLAHSDEFFVQKAIGWALRDYAKVDPGWVHSFVEAHDLKPLSRREALKHI